MSNRIYYNVHTHIFDADCLPDGIMGDGMALKAIRFAKKVKDQRFINWILPSFLHLLSGILGFTKFKMQAARVKRVEKLALAITKGSQEGVYKELIETYKKDGLNNFRFVVLCQDMDHNCYQNNHKNILAQMEEVSRMRRSYGAECLPFVGIDPRHAPELNTSRDIAKIYIEQKSFVGIKIYPASGFFPTDPKLDRVFKYAEENDLPIMIHFNVGVIFYRKNLSDVNAAAGVMFHTKDNALFQMNFANPILFEKVLQKYPKLKLCFAHFSGDYDVDELNKINQNPQMLTHFLTHTSYPPEFLEAKEGRGKKKVMAYWHAYIRDVLIPKYDNVYTDISYQLADKSDEFRMRIKDYLNNSPKLRERILFGTDFYVHVKEGKEEAELIPLVRDLFGQSLFDQIASINAAKYLSSKVYTFKDVVV